MTVPTVSNKDLDVTSDGYVIASDVVRSKTTPNLRHETRVDDSKNFEVDVTVTLDTDDAELSEDFLTVQHTHVRQSAVQRGLVPTGPVKLTKKDRLGNRAVRLVFQVPVELNTVDASVLPGVAVSEQPTDTPADIPERLKGKKVDEVNPKPAEAAGPVADGVESKPAPAKAGKGDA